MEGSEDDRPGGLSQGQNSIAAGLGSVTEGEEDVQSEIHGNAQQDRPKAQHDARDAAGHGRRGRSGRAYGADRNQKHICAAGCTQEKKKNQGQKRGGSGQDDAQIALDGPGIGFRVNVFAHQMGLICGWKILMSREIGRAHV